MTPKQVPLRVDIAGGWTDVPKLSIPGSFIVNCAISPLVSLDNWQYQKGAGLGGSAAYAILNGQNGVDSELNLGVGWQDPAVIKETGLCIWRSGHKPVLEAKINPDFLIGKMALKWLGSSHNTPSLVDKQRDYGLISEAGVIAERAAYGRWYPGILLAVKRSYIAQVNEGMSPLPIVEGSVACKYCGGGYGGYAVYFFETKQHRDKTDLIQIEPYMKGNG